MGLQLWQRRCRASAVNPHGLCGGFAECSGGRPGWDSSQPLGHAASIPSCRVESIVCCGTSVWFGKLTAQSKGPDHTTSRKIKGVHQQHSPRAIFQQSPQSPAYVSAPQANGTGCPQAGTIVLKKSLPLCPLNPKIYAAASWCCYRLDFFCCRWACVSDGWMFWLIVLWCYTADTDVWGKFSPGQ